MHGLQITTLILYYIIHIIAIKGPNMEQGSRKKIGIQWRKGNKMLPNPHGDGSLV